LEDVFNPVLNETGDVVVDQIKKASDKGYEPTVSIPTGKSHFNVLTGKFCRDCFLWEGSATHHVFKTTYGRDAAAGPMGTRKGASTFFRRTFRE
jgi:hypothetical protein